MLIVYFSSTSGNTDRFVQALGIKSARIPLTAKREVLMVKEPYVLISPTYAHEDGANAVPKQVIRFLNEPHNRDLLQGVIAAGNRNFGDNFGLAGHVIAKKCNVPLLYKFELSGTKDDVNNVRQGMKKLWHSLTKSQTIKTQQRQTLLA